jgi:hypothetical protein
MLFSSYEECRYAECHLCSVSELSPLCQRQLMSALIRCLWLCWMSFMLSIRIKSIMPKTPDECTHQVSMIMLSVIYAQCHNYVHYTKGNRWVHSSGVYDYAGTHQMSVVMLNVVAPFFFASFLQNDISIQLFFSWTEKVIRKTSYDYLTIILKAGVP